jgi:hypothetical protein
MKALHAFFPTMTMHTPSAATHDTELLRTDKAGAAT